MFCTQDIVVDLYNKMLERNHPNLCPTQYLYVDFKHSLQSRKEWIMCWSHLPTLQSILLSLCVCVCVCLWPSVSDWTAYQILVTLKIGVLYRKLSCKLEFHENLHIDSHTLLKGINEFLPIISSWLSCLKNGIEDLCEMLWAFLKWCITSCTSCLNESFPHFLYLGYSLEVLARIVLASTALEILSLTLHMVQHTSAT
jgi:hypothetical protein